MLEECPSTDWQLALGLDDQAYRQMLLNVAGVTSSRDLSEAGFRKVMKHFERCGFQSSNHRPAPAGQRMRFLEDIYPS